MPVLDMGGDEFLARPTEKPCGSFPFLAGELRRLLHRDFINNQQKFSAETMNVLDEVVRRCSGGVLGDAAQELKNAIHQDPHDEPMVIQALRNLVFTLDLYLHAPK